MKTKAKVKAKAKAKPSEPQKPVRGAVYEIAYVSDMDPDYSYHGRAVATGEVVKYGARQTLWVMNLLDIKQGNDGRDCNFPPECCKIIQHENLPERGDWFSINFSDFGYYLGKQGDCWKLQVSPDRFVWVRPEECAPIN